ncbi:hypothetical protein CVT24_011032 [Panaeolus cyanescens]|uniref:BIR-domain-containing protein n=1 Tax=Panaeolus cyanescens TaxID=181874 RepID=A0A409VG02_9AGAR|nr:hypothetical protein CVT24_011032 [Panaeolus cyanescens]
MEGLKARLESFKKSKKVKIGQKTKALKWPHPKTFNVTPETLAEAGFYYDPSPQDPDNTTCYVCSKELGAWEETDDPFDIHWMRCGATCCWANVRCGNKFDFDKSGGFVPADKSRIPTSKVMEKARYETFQVGMGWIHDKEPNHGANSKAMARAGFVFTPDKPGDDIATCFYCDLSLSGWEPNDDPLEQHRSRAQTQTSGCPFFTYSADTKKTAKPASKAQSKPSSRSTSRTAHQDLVMPTKEHDGDPDAASDSAQSTVGKSTAKTPRKGRSTSSSSTRKSSAKTPKTKRSTSRSTLKDVAEDEEEAEDGEVSEAPPPPKKKSRSKSVARSEATEEEELIEAPPTVKKKPKPKSSRSETADETEEAEEPEVRKPSRSKAKSKAPVDSQDEAPLKASRSRSKASIAPSTEDTARKSSRSKTKPKVQESEQEDVPVAPVKKNPSHQRTASRSTAKPITIVSDEEEDSEVDVPEPIHKPKSGKQKPSQPVRKDVFDDDDAMDVQVPQTHSQPLHSATDLPPLFIPKRTKSKPVVEEDTSGPSSSREKPKTVKPKSKTKQRTPAPQDSRSEREQSTSDELMPLSPVINQQNLAPIIKEKPFGKSSSFTNASKHSKVKVVEISSDEDVEETPVKRRTPAPGPQAGKENLRGSRATTEEPVLPLPAEIKPSVKEAKILQREPSLEMIVEPSTPPRPAKPDVDADVDMEDVQHEKVAQGPSTPPQPTVQLPSSPKATIPSQPMTTDVPKPIDPPIFPALSKLPFSPLTTLSEAELDMTVEEWIRYQMEVEFDKFRRDGERELQRFRKKAEEVRKVIESL